MDPSHYISRFAALLEFGDETHKVATDAVRLVQRFDRDWMTKGRRPAGICGAALFLAARMNNFRRSIEEIVQVVKIADTTLKKRLDEFKKTPSGSLTLTDFRTVWLEEEMDPPAFLKGKEEEEQEEEEEGNKRKSKKKGQKRKRVSEGEDVEGELTPDRLEMGAHLPVAGSSYAQRPNIDPSLLNSGILAGTITEHDPLFLPDPTEEPTLVSHNPNIDPALLEHISPSPPPLPMPSYSSTNSQGPSPTLVEGVPCDDAHIPLIDAETSPIEATVNEGLTDEVSTFLRNEQGTLLNEALEAAAERRHAQFSVVDELLGLNEEELDAFLLSEEEVRIKERVWVEMNKEYLEAIACAYLSSCGFAVIAAHLLRCYSERRAAGDWGVGKEQKGKFLLFSFRWAGPDSFVRAQRRKTNTKPRDASTLHGSTAAESVQSLLKKNAKYSKRINYNALKDLFDGDEKIEGHGLYIMDDYKEEGIVIEEEGGGGIGKGLAGHVGGDEDAEGEEDVGSQKGDDYGWEDTYEQEV